MVKYNTRPRKKEEDSTGGFYIRSTTRNFFLLLVVVMVAFIIIIGPVRNDLREQKKLSDLQKEYDIAIKEQNYYNGENARRTDDHFVLTYAREHYALVLPGEMAMHITDPENAGTDLDLNNFEEQEKQILTQAQKEFEQYKTPWYERIQGAL